jgi:hypothetical protein
MAAADKNINPLATVALTAFLRVDVDSKMELLMPLPISRAARAELSDTVVVMFRLPKKQIVCRYCMNRSWRRFKSNVGLGYLNLSLPF